MTTSGRTHNQDTGDTLCGICESQHITKCAGQWCPECEEGLCFECQKHHSLSKSTRTHGIISIEYYDTLFMICGYTNWTANCVMFWTIIRDFHCMFYAVMSNF
jgi:hypothetical protein